MLEITRRLRLPMLVSATLTVAVFAVLVVADSAFADYVRPVESSVSLGGDWAPLNRCPVDDPAMLAATGVESLAVCFADVSPSGSMTVGNLAVALKGTDHQTGLVEDFETEGSFSTVPPPGGALVAEPVELPGGLRELVCPGGGRFVRQICRAHHGWGPSERADSVTWTLESAGAPYDFNLFAGVVPGVPVISMPVKIHLQNRLLGNDCYIGSDTEPIVLQGENLTIPVGSIAGFDANGTPDSEEGAALSEFQIHSTQGVGSFAVPAASGCGFMGIYDQAINGKVGLPSAAGKNTLVFNEGSTYLAFINSPELVAPNDGKELSKDWHSAVLPQPEEGRRHGFGHEPPQGSRHWSGHELEEGFRHGLRRGR
jgi:hypothetical protein